MRAVHLMQIIATSGLAIALAGASSFGATVLYVDDDAPPGGDGQSWQTAFMYLQDALSAAEQSGGGIIRVAQGRYQPDLDEAGNVTPGDREATFALISGTSLLGGYAGLGAPDPDARDIDLYETILTGDLAGNDLPDFINYDENSFHVVSALDCDNTAVLDGFMIMAGNADGDSWDRYGAGMTVFYPGAASLHECSFIANRADGCGGGIFNFSVGTTVSACAFIANHAEAGAGVHLDGIDLVVADCSFTDNIASFSGGGIYLSGESVTVTESTFLGNTADRGGGAGIQSLDGSSVTTCTFVGNSALHGGGIYSHYDDHGTIRDCILAANIAEQGGGAIGIEASSQVEVRNCTCSGNSAIDGGGIWKTSEYGAESMFIDVTCTGNSAVRGGGVYCAKGGNLSRCILEDNEATVGGGLYLYQCQGYWNMTDCVIESNIADYEGGGVYVELGAPNFTRCAFTSNAANFDGGAVYVVAGDPTMTDCTFATNVAELGGGGVCGVADRTVSTACTFQNNYADEGGGLHTLAGEPTLTDCTFTANSAETGGGVYGLRAEAVLNGCVFSNNEATDGGGFHDEDGASLLHECTFTGNIAGSGAGCCSRSGGPTLSACTFTENTADVGGGLFSEDAASLVVDCTFIGNSANGGGAVLSYLHDETTLINCLIKGNVAEHGGGLSTSCGHPTLINCALIANNATDYGGAVNHDSDEAQILINCTLAGNTAESGGGAMHVWWFADAVLANCIVWSNGNHPIWGDPTITFSCVEDGYEGEGNIDADPLFVDPDNDDYRLSPGSPCVDAADNDAVPDDEFDLDGDDDVDELIPVDLEWNPRFVDDPDTEDTGHGEPPIVDMGAYEYQPPECPADFDGDGDVDTADLLHLLGCWGGDCGDVDGDGDTDIADLLALLAAWGQCP